MQRDEPKNFAKNFSTFGATEEFKPGDLLVHCSRQDLRYLVLKVHSTHEREGLPPLQWLTVMCEGAKHDCWSSSFTKA